MSLYQEIILDHYRNPRNRGRLQSYDKNCKLENVSCGDKLEMMIKFVDDRVDEIAFEGNGCALSIASASLLTQWAKGKRKEEILAFSQDDLLMLLGLQELAPNRIKCVLLPYEVLQSLVK